MIRAGVGVSIHSEAESAALEAATGAMAGLDGADADWCLAFATSEHHAGLTSLVGRVTDATRTPYVVGCSAAGVLGCRREIERGPALGVLAVRSDQIRATPFLFRDAGDQGLTAGLRLGQRLMGSRGTDDLVVVLPDPMHVRPDRLLHGLDATLGGVPVAGGAASATRPNETFQFCGNEWSRAAVSGVRLGGAFRRRVVVTQGCRPVGGPYRVTRSHENLILEIEGRAAVDLLRDHVEDAVGEVSLGLIPDSGERVVGRGEFLVRNILAVDPDTGVIAIADAVEEGQYVLFAVREAGAARSDLERALASIASERAGYRFALYFNCLARGTSLYDEAEVDVSLLSDALPDVPVLGFFCNAEVAPLRNANRLFTYTGVLVLVGE